MSAARPAARPAGPDLASIAREVFSKGGGFSFQATGASMAPTIRSGEPVLVESFEFDRLRPGDIVMASSHGLVIVHRVIGRTLAGGEPAVITMGDNSVATDPPLIADKIIGLVISVISRGRKVNLRRRLYMAGGRLLALVGRRLAKAGSPAPQPHWRRRLFSGSRLLLKWTLRLSMRLGAV